MELLDINFVPCGTLLNVGHLDWGFQFYAECVITLGRKASTLSLKAFAPEREVGKEQYNTGTLVVSADIDA